MPRPHSRTGPSIPRRLADVGRRFYARHWVLGTSGNFSAVATRTPLALVITASGAHKGHLTGRDFLRVGGDGHVAGRRSGRPSAETALHLEIVAARAAGAALHTHSAWATLVSDLHADRNDLVLHGYEMLKGLSGVTTHAHREWVPIVENDQDMTRLGHAVRRLLADDPAIPAFLIRGHGLYTWGAAVEDAERHVEVLEFLFEVTGRRRQHGHRDHSRAE
jgi:methylthioribulose-1-phosphate dehydratase